MVRLNGRTVHSADEITEDERIYFERIFHKPLTAQDIFDNLTWADTENGRDAWQALTSRYAA